jgi:hypothetical protein
MRTLVRLHGTVTREEGSFLVHLLEIDQMTHARTLEEALSDTFRLVVDHFEACRTIGTYEATLRRLGVPAPADTVDFHVTLDLGQVLPHTHVEQRVEYAAAS